MSKHVSGKITQSTTTSGSGLDKRTTITTSETTNVPGVVINKTKTSRSLREKISTGTNIFALILGFLLIVALYRSLTGTDPITFGGFLEYLSKAPSIDMSMTSFGILPLLEWGGILSGLATFLNFFINIFNVLIFAFKSLVLIL